MDRRQARLISDIVVRISLMFRLYIPYHACKKNIYIFSILVNDFKYLQTSIMPYNTNLE